MDNNFSAFPTWNPSKSVLRNINSCKVLFFSEEKKKEYYRTFRNSSSYFVSKKIVRDFLFKKYNGKCKNCGISEKLEIDHIKSVYRCFIERDFYNCNTLDNLQLLCKKCNCKKTP